VSGPGLGFLVRRALALPPHIAARKACGHLARRAAARRLRVRDHRAGSYGPLRPDERPRRLVDLDPTAVPDDLVRRLAGLAENHMAHRFDLLGSGPCEVRHGVVCEGFYLRYYPPGPAVEADPAGDWLAGRINPANLAESQRLWALIDDPAYRPIDWQLDFRSGWRWREDVYAFDQPIPVHRGADVKVPWELARLQHLPQLALCALLAAAGRSGLRAAETYAREARAQILDFLAANPPRFGINWACPMDVGIRAANMALAVDLLAAAGIAVDAPFAAAFCRSLRDHARHIASHLEWSESGRSNHYLGDLIGLLWAAASLPADAESDAWLAFAARELIGECERQFLPDGGNYEGSTAYHRLSGEICAFGVALILGIERTRADAFASYDNRAVRVRPPFPRAPLPRHRHSGGRESVVPPAVFARLWRAAALARAVTRADGRFAQIGDCDSGRLFKLHPVGEESAGGFRENALDAGGFVAAVHALFDGENAPEPRLEGALAAALAGGFRAAPPESAEPAPFGDLDAAVARIATLPEEARRTRRIPFPHPVPREAWRRAAFPDFGVYVFRADALFVLFRCGGTIPATAPTGHRHDDDLGVEFLLGEGCYSFDPGTFVYTPDASVRNRYRSADAHDVPRAEGWEVAPPGADLFALPRRGTARCVAWGPRGAAGVLETPEGRLLRAVEIADDALLIHDGAEGADGAPARLRDLGPTLPYSDGYGSQTENPSRSV